MGRLVYTAIASLDGYIADESGDFSWSQPDEEVHAFVNDLERPIGTHLLGRAMYEVLAVWERPETFGAETFDELPPVLRDYAAIWRASDKIVFSRTIEAVASARTRIEREFDPEAVRALKESAAHDLAIGGAGLAAQALEAGLVDELNLLLSPVVVGGGKAALPDGLRLDLSLVAERRFANGVVYLRYDVA